MPGGTTQSAPVMTVRALLTPGCTLSLSASPGSARDTVTAKSIGISLPAAIT
ncbi:hypothetical protein D9M72_263550 [compost metagenome]